MSNTLNNIGWIVVINLVLYFKTLRYKLVSDDFTVLKNPPVFKNAWHKAWLRFIGAAKLLSTSVHFVRSNGKSYVAILKNEEFEHFLALVIHIAICIAIYFAFGTSQVSFIAALLYSVNPVNNQGTIWPGGRGYALPILSLLLAMIFAGHSIHQFLSFPNLPLCAIFLGFCSWWTIGFLAPLVLIGSSQFYILMLMPFVWLFHSRKFTTAIKLKSSMETFEHDKRMHPRKIVVFVKTYGFYLALCIFPTRITFYHNFLQSMAGNDIMRKRAYSMDRYFLIGLLGIVGTAAISVLHWGLLAWALLAFFIGVAPFCNVIRANQEIAERFVALPNVFLMYALAQVICMIGGVHA